MLFLYSLLLTYTAAKAGDGVLGCLRPLLFSPLPSLSSPLLSSPLRSSLLAPRSSFLLSFLFSSLLAKDLGAHALIISTESGAIYRGFGTDAEEALKTLTVAEARSMDEAGEFPPGSMAPKVNALCEFLQQSGEGMALLCAPGEVLHAMRGECGTTITAS